MTFLKINSRNSQPNKFLKKQILKTVTKQEHSDKPARPTLQLLSPTSTSPHHSSQQPEVQTCQKPQSPWKGDEYPCGREWEALYVLLQ